MWGEESDETDEVREGSDDVMSPGRERGRSVVEVGRAFAGAF